MVITTGALNTSRDRSGNGSDNTSNEKISEDDPTLCILVIFLDVFLVSINTYVITMFVRRSSLRSNSNLLLLSLAASDLTAGLVTIPLITVPMFLKQFLPHVHFEVYKPVFVMGDITTVFTAAITILNLCAITCDRYLLLCHPMSYRDIVNKRKVVIGIIILWTLALCYAVSPLSWLYKILRKNPTAKEYYNVDQYDNYYSIIGFILLFLPLVMMIAAYARMFQAIHKLRLSIGRYSLCESDKDVVASGERRAISIFSIMFIVFIICWAPWIILRFVMAVDKEVFRQVPKPALDTFLFIRFLTSIINPILYTIFKLEFYREFQKDWGQVLKYLQRCLACCEQPDVLPQPKLSESLNSSTETFVTNVSLSKRGSGRKSLLRIPSFLRNLVGEKGSVKRSSSWKSERKDSFSIKSKQTHSLVTDTSTNKATNGSLLRSGGRDRRNTDTSDEIIGEILTTAGDKFLFVVTDSSSNGGTSDSSLIRTSAKNKRNTTPGKKIPIDKSSNTNGNNLVAAYKVGDKASTESVNSDCSNDIPTTDTKCEKTDTSSETKGNNLVVAYKVEERARTESMSSDYSDASFSTETKREKTDTSSKTKGNNLDAACNDQERARTELINSNCRNDISITDTKPEKTLASSKTKGNNLDVAYKDEDRASTESINGDCSNLVPPGAVPKIETKCESAVHYLSEEVRPDSSDGATSDSSLTRTSKKNKQHTASGKKIPKDTSSKTKGNNLVVTYKEEDKTRTKSTNSNCSNAVPEIKTKFNVAVPEDERPDSFYDNLNGLMEY